MKGLSGVYGSWGCGTASHSSMISTEKALLVKNSIAMTFLWHWENTDWGKLSKVIMVNKCPHVLIVKSTHHRDPWHRNKTFDPDKSKSVLEFTMIWNEIYTR